MCLKYFDECFMDKNLLHLSLAKFNNKLNKSKKRTFLIAQSFSFCFKFSFHFQQIFS